MSTEQKLEITPEMAQMLEKSQCSCDSEFTFFAEPHQMTEKEYSAFIKSQEYLRGINRGAYICGIYNSLVNAGFDVSVAMETAVGIVSLEMSKEIQSIVSKNVSAAKEKEEI